MTSVITYSCYSMCNLYEENEKTNLVESSLQNTLLIHYLYIIVSE